MFNSARWRGEKNKLKVLFKLQFHATQVSQERGDGGLTISVVPADVGKPTVKLEKATIRDGSCYWDTPVHETVKFVRDSKTGKIHERIYHFSVGTGSSKGGAVGEASLDLSCYALTTKISSVSLPLKNSRSDGVLHVSIQRVLESDDQREIEVKESETAEPNSQDRSLRAQISNSDGEASIEQHSIDETSVNKSINHSAEMNGNRRASSGSDVTTSSSDSSMGLDTQIQIKIDGINQGPKDFNSSLSNGSVLHRATSDVLATPREEQQKSWEWLGGLSLEASTDDSSGTPKEALLRETSQEVQDIVVEKLKSELMALSRQAEMSELELQTLRKQIVKESRKGHDLSREIRKLKEERDNFKEECEKLKALQACLDDAKVRNKLQFEGVDSHTLLEELQQELNHEKNLNNNLRIQLQKTQESNSELILAVRDLDEMFEQKNKEISDLLQKYAASDSAEKLVDVNYKYEIEYDDEDQRALEDLVKEHTDAKEAYLLEQKILDLQSEIEIYRRKSDDLETQMEQLALDYEILKQGNHDMSYKLEQSQLQEQLKMQYECTSSYANLHELESQIEKLESELKKSSEKCSDSSNTISELEREVKRLKNELWERSQEYSDSLITISELQAQVTSLKNESKEQLEQYSNSLISISELEAQVTSFKNESKEQSEQYSNSLTTISELEAQVITLKNESKEQSDQNSISLITISELQAHVTSLENEIKEWSEEHSNSLIAVKKLEDHVKTLEEVLEKQAQGFEADIEALTNVKVEQEQRAIRAEESLRKMRWQNASTAEHLQEEFRKLSVQMASTFEANESLAAKSLSEANELRLQKRHLEDKLEKASVDLQLVRDHYELRLHELSSKLLLTSNHIKDLQADIQDKSMQLDDQAKHAGETQMHLTEEIQMLKAEIGTLKTGNQFHSDLAKERDSLSSELEEIGRFSKEMEFLLKKANGERAEFKSRVALLKEREQSLLRELHSMLCLKDEKDSTARILQLEVDTLKGKCEELKQTLSEDELEKENLRKQLLQLKGDLKRREDAFNSIEKKVKESNGLVPVSDGTKPTPKNNKFQQVPRAPKEVANLKDRIKLLEGEIKLKETALENSTSSFLEKEKDLQDKIQDLEQRLGVINSKTTSFCEADFNKVAEVSDLALAEELRNAPGEPSTEPSVERGAPASMKCGHETFPEEESKGGSDVPRELLSEMTLLKVKNNAMEGELKEMQERYSEISLKFAEVEGERQQLVMKLRSLKNVKKNP